MANGINNIERKCELCKIDINHMRRNARFCCRNHKRITSDSKRNYTLEYQRNKETRKIQALNYYYADHENLKKRN
jgi:hypothetical protein